MAAENKKFTGTCKWFNSVKGFGFVSVDGTDEDVFVHQSEIHADGFRNLAEGEKLEFEIVAQDDGKKKAVKVTGPNGDYVKGQAKPQRPDGDYNNFRGGYGGRGRGNYRGGRGRGGYGGGRGGYGGGGGYNRGYNNNNNNNQGCFNCGQQGHWARECQQPPQQQQQY